MANDLTISLSVTPGATRSLNAITAAMRRLVEQAQALQSVSATIRSAGDNIQAGLGGAGIKRASQQVSGIGIAMGGVAKNTKAASKEIASLGQRAPAVLSAFGLGGRLIPGGGGGFSNIAQSLGFAAFLGKSGGIGLGTVGLLTGLGAAAAAFAGSASLAVEQTQFLEERLVRTARAAGRSGENIKDLRDGLISLTRDSGQFGLKDTVVAVESLVKAGVSIKDVFGGAGKTALDFSLVSETSTSVAVDSLINVASQLETSTSVAADAIVRAADISTASVQDMMQFFTRGAFSGRSLGFSVTEIGAISAALAQMGLRGERGARAFQRMAISFERLKNDSLTAAQADAFERLGVSVEGVQNGSVKLLDFLKILDRAGAGVGDLSSIFDVFGGQAAAALIGMLPKMQEFQQQMEGMQGATEQTANVLKGTLAGSLRALGVQFDLFLSSVGPFFSSVFGGIIDVGTLALNVLMGIANATGDILTNMGLIRDKAEDLKNFSSFEGFIDSVVNRGDGFLNLGGAPENFFKELIGANPKFFEKGGFFESFGKSVGSKLGDLDKFVEFFLNSFVDSLPESIKNNIDPSTLDSVLIDLRDSILKVAREPFNAARQTQLDQEKQRLVGLINPDDILGGLTVSMLKGKGELERALSSFIKILGAAARSLQSTIDAQIANPQGVGSFGESLLNAGISAAGSFIATSAQGFLTPLITKALEGVAAGLGTAIGGPLAGALAGLLAGIFVDAANALVNTFARALSGHGAPGQDLARRATRMNTSQVGTPTHEGQSISMPASAGMSINVDRIVVAGGGDSSQIGRAITRELSLLIRRENSNMCRAMSTRKEGRELV